MRINKKFCFVAIWMLFVSSCIFSCNKPSQEDWYKKDFVVNTKKNNKGYAK